MNSIKFSPLLINLAVARKHYWNIKMSISKKKSKMCTHTFHQKNQIIDLHNRFETYCNVLPVSGCNSANYDLNLIESYLLPLLVDDRRIEPILIKTASQFVPVKFGEVELLDIMNFLRGATSCDY